MKYVSQDNLKQYDTRIKKYIQDKYSKMAKAIECLGEKAEIVKDLFEDSDELDFRKKHHYEDDDYEDYRPRKRSGRYY